MAYEGLRDYDVYRLTEDLTKEDMQELEALVNKVVSKYKNDYHKFFKEFNKVFEKKQ
jgi:hypothetical protein